jgi:5-methylcytosine-specific restriction endonuclease McrA
MTRGKKTRAGGTWSEARYFSFIRSNLRRAWSKYPVKYAAKKAVELPNDGRYDKRTKKMYPCSECGEIFKGSEVEVDHILPAGSLKTYQDLPGFVERLFCEIDNLRVVCKPCHKEITAKERKNAKAKNNNT